MISQEQYKARRSAVLLFLLATLIVMGAGLMLVSGDTETRRIGARAELPGSSATAPNY